MELLNTNKKNSSKSKNLLFLLVFLLLIQISGWGQTNPVAQNLPYTQNFGTTTFTSMPAGTSTWALSVVNSQSSAEISAPTADATVSAATASTGTGGSYGYCTLTNGRFYIQTSSSTTNGTNQLITAINTGSNTAIGISYDLEMIRPGTMFLMGWELQYRSGTSGAWTTVPYSNTNYFSISGNQGDNDVAGDVDKYYFSISGLTQNTVYQLRWITWRKALTGSSASAGMAIDNISISGITSPCAMPTSIYTQAFNSSSTPIGWIVDTYDNATLNSAPAITYVATGSVYNTTTSSNVSVSPTNGNSYMVKFNSYSCDANDRVILRMSSPFSTSNYNNIKVSFDFFLQSSYYGESISLQWSTDGFIWNNLNALPTYSSSDSWTNVSWTLPNGAENLSNLYLALNLTSGFGNDCYLDNFRVTGCSPPCTVPTTQATIGSFSYNTGTSITANWSRGSGDAGVLVVARLTSDVAVDPTSGVSYTDNVAFGSGSTTGIGNYVVYKGTGTSVNVTGLTACNDYTFAVYEYNSSGTCFKTPGSSSSVTMYGTCSQTFTSSGTWIAPCGVTSATVECWGGGGAGGSARSYSSSYYASPGGGAGGAYAKGTVTVTPNSSYTVTVGAAVTSSSTDLVRVSGNPSWFGTSSTVYAPGGQGGETINAFTGYSAGDYYGYGGAGSSTGAIGNMATYAGGSGSRGSSAYGGGGGGGSGGTVSAGNSTGTVSSTTASPTGSTSGATAVSGGGAGGNGASITGSNGSNGSIPGGGGGGAWTLGTTLKTGGQGAAGQVKITWDYAISATPTVNSPICVGATTVSGTSSEVTGSTVTVYKNGIVWGTTTTITSNSWSVSGPALANGDVITAKVQASCKYISTTSSDVTIPNTGISATATATPATICVGSSSSLQLTLNSDGISVPSGYTTTGLGGSGLTYISLLTLNTLNYSANSSAVSPYYKSMPFSGASTTSLTLGQTLTANVNTALTAIVSIWVDFNRNGSFETSEWFQPYTNATSGTVSIIVPSNASVGQTIMRIRSRTSGFSNGSGDANTNFATGETIDFTVTILPSPSSFTWSNGTSTVGTTNPLSVSPTSNTTYTPSATVNGCPVTTSGVFVTVNQPTLATNTSITNGDYIWRGVISADWNTASNWVSYNGSTYSIAGSAPSNTLIPNVIIPATSTNCPVSNFPNTSATTVYGKNVTIETNASVTMGSGTMNVTGNFTNNGTFTCGTGKVIFNGTASDQTIGGSSTTAFSKLAVNKTNANTDTLRILTSSTIQDSLILTDGIIKTTSSNNLTLLSGSKTGIGNAGSYVNGPLNYVLSSMNLTTLNLPIGLNSDWRPIELNLTHNSTTPYTYTAKLYNSSANSLGWSLPNDNSLERVSYVHYVDVERTPSSSADLNSATIKIYYSNTNGSDDGVTDYSNLAIAKANINGPDWTNIGGTATANGIGSITSNSFTSFSRFTLANKSGGTNPLPVTLTDFTTACQNQQVKLQWSTQAEINNDFFGIERSADGILFNEIGRVAGHGNSNATHHYQYFDEQSLKGISYYRLNQHDFNGVSKLYPFKSVTCDDEADAISIYPNPNTGTFEVSGLAEGNIINVTDVLGKTVYSAISKSTKETLKLLDVKPGIYFIEIKDHTGKVNTKKIIIE